VQRTRRCVVSFSYRILCGVWQAAGSASEPRWPRPAAPPCGRRPGAPRPRAPPPARAPRRPAPPPSSCGRRGPPRQFEEWGVVCHRGVYEYGSGRVYTPFRPSQICFPVRQYFLRAGFLIVFSRDYCSVVKVVRLLVC
jgi:hypothetical protein